MVKSNHSRRILVVDDDPLIGLSLKEALSRWKFDVTLTYRGEQALGALSECGFDVVLTDIRMPEITGLELLEKIKAMSPSTAVILITAYGNVDQAVEAIKSGADDYITKPFSLEKIRQCVTRILQEKENNRINFNPDRLPSQSQDFQTQFIGQNPKIVELLKSLEIAYKSDAPVFIQGESGTGKELIASAIHHHSDRLHRPYLKINCAALPETLIESQLFGHEKGAFTGAIRTFKGVFEEADGGTLLLDEITEMPTHLQAKFLRVLQEGEFQRLGSTRSIKTNVRIICTSNRDVDQAISEGSFREDLFFRLDVISVKIPPLRERKDDIPLLCNYFIKKYNIKYKKEVLGLEQPVLNMFMNYDWPGNVRELENVIQRGVLKCPDRAKINIPMVRLRHCSERISCTPKTIFDYDMSLKEMEKTLIQETLKRHNYHKTKTAQILGITLKTLTSKMRLHGLE